MRSQCLLVLVFASLAVQTSAQVNNCDLLCPVLPDVPQIPHIQEKCAKLCHEWISTITDKCVTSLEAWATTNKTIGQKAQFASANLGNWATMLMGAASAASSDLKAVEGMAVEGLLYDYGKHDVCVQIPKAQYCYTQLHSRTIATGGIPAGAVALCMPQTCSSADLDIVWTSLFEVAGVNTQFEADTICGEQSMAWSDGSWIMLAICVLLVVLVVLASAAEVWTTRREADRSNAESANEEYQELHQGEESSVLWKYLECFSVPQNLRKFCCIRSGTATSSLDGVRTFSMMWVVLGHTLVWPFSDGPPGYSNLGDIMPVNDPGALLGTWSGQAILSAEFSVDSFFFMSGFLATYIGLKKIGNRGIIAPLLGAPFMYLDRWLRLTPVYMFIVLIYTYLVPVFSSGPFWVEEDQPACRANIWQNLLYIQTLFQAFQDRGETCYTVSWYLADDMMFFYLVPLVIALALVRRSVVYLVMGIAAVASITAGIIIADQNKLSPSPFDPTGLIYMSKYYYPPWTRLPAYLVGTTFGIIWRDHQETIVERVQGSSLVQGMLWLVSASILGSCTWGNAGQLDTIPSELYNNRFRADMFVAVAKPAWCVGLAVLCVLNFSRVGGIAQWILEAPIFGYLSKLTFTVYLSHPIMLFIWIRSFTAPINFSLVGYSLAFCGILLTSTAFAFVVHLIIEQPTANLLAILMAPKPRPRPRPSQDKEEDQLSALPVMDSRWVNEDTETHRHSMPLPFEGESSFLPADSSHLLRRSVPVRLALPMPAAPALPTAKHGLTMIASSAPGLRSPLAGPDMENQLLSEMA